MTLGGSVERWRQDEVPIEAEAKVGELSQTHYNSRSWAHESCKVSHLTRRLVAEQHIPITKRSGPG